MKIIYRINPTITAAAKKADAKKAQEIIDNVQAAWDAGESFLSTGFALDDMFSRPREADSDAEADAAAQQMQDALAGLAVKGAVQMLKKETVQTMCSALTDADPFAKITLYGVTMSVSALLAAWNETHEEKIYIEPGFET